MEINNVEILAPAGSYESVLAAINAGADAVYIGGTRFGARAYADNPEEDMLIKAIDYVHLHNRKIYLTVNTLLKNNEIKEELYQYLMPYYKAGLDAVIVQDLGVLNCIHKWFPNLDIHASTQMVITGAYGAGILKDMGVTRIVTARELSLEEIKNIKDNCDIEIESFVHGALCYCYSGQCLMSSMLGGRSGNRGRCAQPCRLPYDVVCGENVQNKSEKYILSPKDMCTLNILPEIIEAGVYSLKIEGRMKSPEYTAGVVSIYRKYVDLLCKYGKDRYKVHEKDYAYLEQLYSRCGFNDGYYKKHNGKDMITMSKPSYNGQNANILNDISKKYLDVDSRLIIDGYVSIVQNEAISVTVICGEHSATVTGNIPFEALNRPISEEAVYKQMNKTGGSMFKFKDINIYIDGNVFVQIKEINELRRRALNILSDSILNKYRRCEPDRTDFDYKEYNTKKSGGNCGINCLVSTEEQLMEVLKFDEVEWVYISLDNLNYSWELWETVKTAGKKIALAMPYVFRQNAINYMHKIIDIVNQYMPDGFLVRNLDEIKYIKTFFPEIPIISDYYIYSFNDFSLIQQRKIGISKITEPLELNFRELKNKKSDIGEMVVYGYIPLMVTAGCVNKNIKSCDGKTQKYKLVDRYKVEFDTINVCRFCYNLIYNSVPLSYLSVSGDILKLNPESVRLQFTEEDAEETNRILHSFINNYRYNGSEKELDRSTRGHLKRGVE